MAVGDTGDRIAMKCGPQTRPSSGGEQRSVVIASLVVLIAWILLVAEWSPSPPSLVVDAVCSRLSKRAWPIVPVAAQFVGSLVLRSMLLVLIGIAVRWVPPKGGSRIAGQLTLIALLCAAATIVHRPSLAGVFLFAPCFAVAVWGWCSVGMAAVPLRGVAWLAGSVLGIALVAWGVVRAGIQPDPAAERPVAMTKEDHDRLQRMLSEAGQVDEAPIDILLSPADLDGIATSWMASQATDARVSIRGGGDGLVCSLSWPVGGAGRAGPYLNVTFRAKPFLSEARVFEPGLDALRIGRIHVPAPFVSLVSDVIGTSVSRVPEWAGVLGAFDALSVDAGKVHVVVDPDKVSAAFASSMEVSPSASARLREKVRSLMRSTLETSSGLPEGDARFEGLLRNVFESAAKLHGDGDEVECNRAALVGLAIQIGDPRVRRMAGFPVREKMAMFPFPYDQRVTLRGRNDLARHFIVSAALTALSTPDIAFTIGLFKEQLDAIDGGSGLSFADIAADMAGVRFARHVLDPVHVRDVSLRLDEAGLIDAVMPPIDGLPEGLSQTAFEESYGSLDDPRYRATIVVIEHRLEGCELLRENGVRREGADPISPSADRPR